MSNEDMIVALNTVVEALGRHDLEIILADNKRLREENATLREVNARLDRVVERRTREAEHAGAKWVKCSERYPDNSSAVLVYVRDGTIYDHCAMYCQAVDYYQFNGQWSHCTDVTHWRPLPLSPEAESK